MDHRVNFIVITSVKTGSVGNTRLLCHEFLSLAGRLCSGGKRFDRANLVFAAYFILRGHEKHIEFLRLLFLIGTIRPLTQKHFL